MEGWLEGREEEGEARERREEEEDGVKEAGRNRSGNHGVLSLRARTVESGGRVEGERGGRKQVFFEVGAEQVGSESSEVEKVSR